MGTGEKAKPKSSFDFEHVRGPSDPSTRQLPVRRRDPEGTRTEASRRGPRHLWHTAAADSGHVPVGAVEIRRRRRAQKGSPSHAHLPLVPLPGYKTPPPPRKLATTTQAAGNQETAALLVSSVQRSQGQERKGAIFSEISKESGKRSIENRRCAWTDLRCRRGRSGSPSPPASASGQQLVRSNFFLAHRSSCFLPIAASHLSSSSASFLDLCLTDRLGSLALQG